MENFTEELDLNVSVFNLSIFDDDYLSHSLYSEIVHIFVLILIIAALIAMLVNMIVFTSVYWIRRPMTPILKVSLSLAAADALSSSLFAASLFINTYLPVFGINVKWLQVIMEMVKLSGILITVTHLLALSLNHYIGILKPLHYNSIVTRRKVTAVTILLWIGPTIFIIALFTIQAEKSYWIENFLLSPTIIDENFNFNKTIFYDTFKFRLSFSLFFFISLILMALCYFHILIVVRRQQNKWKNLSRIGSSKWKGKTSNSTHSNKTNKEKKQLEGNIRAVYTTLLILGSCVIGWMPALLIFVLMCKKDCYIHGEQLEYINKNYLIQVMFLRLIENMLIILKMLANPIIYSIRMKEIQDSTKHFHSSLISIFCPSRLNNINNYTLASRNSTNKSKIFLQSRKKKTNSNSNFSNAGRSDIANTLL